MAWGLALSVLVAPLTGAFWQAAAQDAGPPTRAEVSGRPELVFQRTGNVCDARFLPDTAARAFRDASGTIHLIATWQQNYAMIGRNFQSLRLDCSLLYRGEKNADPSAFDDNAWLTSFFTTDGRTVYALVHDEYHGLEHPGACAQQTSRECWYNAVTLTVSHDGGMHFEHLQPANELVASVPYRYGTIRMPAGLFEPSNIVQLGSFYFVMMTMLAPGRHRGGTCLLRTDRLDDAGSWRAWDGTGFGVSFVNPYGPDATEAGHVCAPIAPDELMWHVSSLVHYGAGGLFIAVMQATKLFPRGAVATDGVYMSTSADLIHWSSPTLVMPAASKFHFACGGAEPIMHPSLIDHDAHDRNFVEVGNHPYLYYSIIHPVRCRTSMNVDLARVRLTLRSR